MNIKENAIIIKSNNGHGTLICLQDKSVESLQEEIAALGNF